MSSDYYFMTQIDDQCASQAEHDCYYNKKVCREQIPCEKKNQR